MKKKSDKGKVVRTRASKLPRTTHQDMDRLRAAMTGTVDTSDAPEQLPGTSKTRRTITKKRRRAPKSVIREAILEELEEKQITRYQLWKRARIHCQTLSESAVYEFLRGDRQVGLQYIEALMAALDLRVHARTA